MDDLKKLLIKGAQSKGICAPGLARLERIASKGEAVDYYVENPDWCLERNFPDLHTLTERFADCESKGVFVNRTFHGEMLDERQAYIFHNCKGMIRTGVNARRKIIPMFYLANGCRLRIVDEQKEYADYPPEIPVYLFGKNDVSARSTRWVKFRIFRQDLL